MPWLFFKLTQNILSVLKITEYSVLFTETHPDHSKIPQNIVVVVGGKGWAKWAIMRCPCGCNDVLTLSLMKRIRPNWNIKFDFLNRISISPSIWKKDGCCSHFFVKKGRIIWAKEA